MRDENFKPKMMVRKRIDKTLLGIFEVPIFFVFAPMGYGKTTAVKSFLEKKKDVKVIWYDSYNYSDDAFLIWENFCKMIKITNLEFSKKLRQCGPPKSAKRIYSIIDLVRNEVNEKIVVVIDDWHETENKNMNQFIKAMALHCIPNLHLVMISRNRPAYEFVELELKEKCIIMQQEDMAFTFDETKEFFKVNGICLCKEEEKEVYGNTDGWISAIYLGMLQYCQEGNFKDIHKATELVKTAVYYKFDDITQNTLLRLSLLDHFTLEQAIYVTGNKQCGKVIRNLLINNCFIRFDNKLKEYTLHSILKNALREEIFLSDIDIKDIYNKCGDWYYEKKENVAAIKYYYMADNFNRVLDLVETGYTIELTGLRQTIINSVFNKLTMEQKISRPIAYLTYIFFYILYENPVEGQKLLNHVKEIYEADNNLEDKNSILGEIAFLESLSMFSDIKKMTNYHKKAFELFAGGTSRIANNKMPVTFGSPHFLFLYHRNPGKLKEMVEYFAGSVEHFVHISNGGASGVNYLIKAEYYFETGDSKKGKIYAQKAFDKAASKNQTSVVLCALFLMVRIYINTNDQYMARKTYNYMLDEYETLNMPSWLDGQNYAKAFLNAIAGDYKNIPDNVWDSNNYEFEKILPIASIKYISQGLAILYERDYVKLDVHADIMISETKDSIFTIIYAYIFKAISQNNQQEADEAKQSLLIAVNLAEQDNLIMTFVELSPHIIDMLRELADTSSYIKNILPRCEQFSEYYSKYNCIELSMQLTPREIQVMRLVDQGYKQSEISQKLSIALITVKKHVASVYLKLKVKNKTKALNILKDRHMI